MWSPADIRVPVPFHGMEEVLAEAAARGLGAEVQGMYNPERLGTGYGEALSRIAGAFQGFRNPVALHAPFFDLNPVSPDPGIASLSRRRYEQAFETADASGATLLVFHSQFATATRDPRYAGQWLTRSTEYWSSLAPALAAKGRTVAIENIFEKEPSPVVRLLDALASPRFRSCLDVGHAHLFSGDAAGFARGLGNRIAHVHLHDNDGVWDDHRPPGEGTAGVAGVLSVLAELVPIPSLTLEMHNREDVARSLEWLGEKGFLKSGT
jgi:sugar phosphate isomerase/epimerase